MRALRSSPLLSPAFISLHFPTHSSNFSPLVSCCSSNSVFHKHQLRSELLDPSSRVSDLVRLRKRPTICLMNRFPDADDDAGSRTSLWELFTLRSCFSLQAFFNSCFLHRERSSAGAFPGYHSGLYSTVKSSQWNFPTNGLFNVALL